MFSLERLETCWSGEFKNKLHSQYWGSYEFYCVENRLNVDGVGVDTVRNSLNSSCPFIDPDDILDPNVFNFGIFIDALKSSVVATSDFPKKFLYCFWWGLRNLRLVIT